MATLRQELIIAIKADTGSAKTSLEALKKSTSDLQKAAKQVQTSFSSMGKVLGGSGMTSSVSTTAKRVVTSARSIASGMAFSGRAVRTVGTRMVGVFGRVGSAMTTMGRTAGSVFSRITSPIKAAGRMGTSVLGLLGLGGGAVLAKTAAKDAMDFERVMARAWTLRGGPKSYFLSLKEEITKMSIETSKPLEDLAQGLYDIYSGLPGIADKDALSLLKQMSALSTVGGSSIGAVVKLGVSALNVYGSALGNTTNKAKQLEYALDNTFMAVKYGVTTVDEMVSAVGPILGLSKLAGVPFKEVMEAMAVLTRAGIPTDVAATSLGQIFTSILKPKQASLKQAEEIGIDIRPSKISKYGFMPWLLDAFTRAETAKDPERVLGTLFGNVRALRGVAAIQGMGGVVGEVQQGFKGSPGSVLSAQDLVKSTSTFSLDIMVQRLKIALADLGTGIIHGLSGSKNGVLGLFSKYMSSEAMFTLGRQLVETGKTIYEAIMVIPRFFTWVIKDFRSILNLFLYGLKHVMYDVLGSVLEYIPGMGNAAKELKKEASKGVLTSFFEANVAAQTFSDAAYWKNSLPLDEVLRTIREVRGGVLKQDFDEIGLPQNVSVGDILSHVEKIAQVMTSQKGVNEMLTRRGYVEGGFSKEGIEAASDFVTQLNKVSTSFEGIFSVPTESESSIQKTIETLKDKNDPTRQIARMRLDVFNIIKDMYLPGMSEIGKIGTGPNVFSMEARIPIIGDTVTGHLKKSILGGPEGKASKVQARIPGPALKDINQQRQAAVEKVALQYLLNSGETLEESKGLIQMGVFLLKDLIRENQRNTAATMDTNATLKTKTFRLPNVERTITEVGNSQTKVTKPKKGN